MKIVATKKIKSPEISKIDSLKEKLRKNQCIHKFSKNKINILEKEIKEESEKQFGGVTKEENEQIYHFLKDKPEIVAEALRIKGFDCTGYMVRGFNLKVFYFITCDGLKDKKYSEVFMWESYYDMLGHSPGLKLYDEFFRPENEEAKRFKDLKNKMIEVFKTIIKDNSN